MNTIRLVIFHLALLFAGILSIGSPVQAQSIADGAMVQYPALGLWNGFLNQLNVVECNNFSTEGIFTELTLFDQLGSARGSRNFFTPPGGIAHVILNEFGISSAYGTYLLTPQASSDAKDRFRCQTAIYSLTPTGSSKSVNYAYMLPVMNPLHGESAGTFNSMNPEGSAEAVANWLSLHNASGQTFSADIEVYSLAGDLLRTLQIQNLPPRTRTDLPLGHNEQQNGGQTVGSYRIRPTDSAVAYGATLIRFGTRGGNLIFAFPAFASKGSCQSEPVFTSTMNPALNWAEISNVSSHSAEYSVEFRNSIGQLLSTETLRLRPFEQYHFYVNRFLGSANLGSLRVICSDPANDRAIAQSLFYGLTTGGVSTVEWAYISQERGFYAEPGRLLSVPANTFLGMLNWFKIIDTSLLSASVDVETFAAGSATVSRQEASFVAAASKDFFLNSSIAKNNIGGALAGSPVSGNTLTGEAIRVFPRTDGNIGSIMAVPALPIAGDIPKINLNLVQSGFSQPIAVRNAGDSSGRLFVVERAGRIKILQSGTILPTPFLDISGLVSGDGEQGLLGLAFHPQYSSNGRLFIDYTDTAGAIVIAEYQVSGGNANLVNPSSARTILRIEKPFPNHNGGDIAFGPDGYLYITTGDGGSLGDPLGNAQNKNILLGKILRIDVNSSLPYAIPPGNPFVNTTGLDEIWAYGFRNPWRFAFDFTTNRLFVGDVGQGSREEIDLVTGGGNYGWKTMEGNICFSPSSNCNTQGLLPPIAEYNHDLGFAVTGGFVYRGAQVPQISGHYIFADFGSSRIWSLTENNNGTWIRRELLKPGFPISAFGLDESNELYVVDYGGSVYKVVD